ncbi:uncharacterized protein LOC143907335 [Temnothorax americanus]|uniref:uncharacterized protein LOC143907335 n=1 Tax=Temnothorax americanus TaxID=1964332 RepID=UPI004068819A
MECKGKRIIEAVEKIVEEKVKKMLREVKEDGKRKNEKIEELEEEMKRLKRKVERMEQNGGKRKRDDSEKRAGKKKWWAGEEGRNDEEMRKKNVIIRIKKKKWKGKESNWEKVKELFTDGLKVKVEIREVRVIGQKGAWLTILVRLEDKEKKWRVLEARRRAGNRIGVKMDEDKSVERRDRERKKKERRLERRSEDCRSTGRSEENEISKEMKEKLLMTSDEEKEDKRKRE